MPRSRYMYWAPSACIFATCIWLRACGKDFWLCLSTDHDTVYPIELVVHAQQILPYLFQLQNDVYHYNYCRANSYTLFCHTHTHTHTHTFSAAIVIVRNPFPALVAEYTRRRTNYSHVDSLERDRFGTLQCAVCT